MKKCIFVIFFLGIFDYARSQNVNNTFFKDSIYPLLDKQYYVAKLNFQKIYQPSNNKVDPSLLVIVMVTALKKNDNKFFKILFKDLVKNFGYVYTKYDTLKDCENSLSINIHKKGMSKWAIEVTNKYSQYWNSNHINESFIIKEILKIHSQDQYIKKFNFYSQCLKDSSCYISKLNELEFDNIRAIHKLFKIEGKFLNNFDYGIAANTISIAIIHSLYNQTNCLRTWSLLGKFIEEAYLDGKIDSYIFQIYDQRCIEYYGYQYYGTQESNIIDNDNSILQRKLKFKF